MINGINEDNLSEALVDKADIDLGNVSEINGEMNLQLETKADKTSVSDLQTQINSLQALVNQLQTTLASAKYVVETWRDGTEWYRKYNDGWIEQGGFVSLYSSGSVVNLHKTMSDTSYHLICVIGGTVAREQMLAAGSKTTTTFKAYHSAGLNNGFGLYWSVYGY